LIHGVELPGRQEERQMTIGELQNLLNTYMARSGLSIDSEVFVELIDDDGEPISQHETTMVSCHVKYNEATIYAQ